MSTDGQDGAARADTLDLPPGELEELGRAFGRMALDYLSGPEALPVFPDTSAEELAALFGGGLPEEGAGLEALKGACAEVFRLSRQNGHPRMFGYVASPATPVGAWASLAAAALNSNVTSWRSAPGPTEVERTAVRWLAELIGFRGEGLNEGCGGLLTSGGSMANLNALFVAHRAQARDASRRGLWGERAPATLYASDQVHLSVPKAADILGLGREQVRAVPSDEGFGVDVRALRERIEADVRAGLRPFCVVASAGTVSTGAVDDLRGVAGVAREHSLWFHVDGAYGALAACAASKRALFAGLEDADSVSLDPHKWLYTPLGAGCLLFREPGRARAAYAATEEGYIKVFEREEAEAFAFWDYGTELSRPFRALKVWATLLYYGARRVGAAIEEDCRVASYMAERVSAAEDFELLAPVTLGICCFRYVPADARRGLEDVGRRGEFDARLDDLNERVVHRVQRGGEAYVSNAVLRGRFALRASITNYRTTRRDIDLTLEVIRRAARELEG
ncbi:MAG TPA: pyridoxal-dependent decarboxylase [Pyrinomonadaceae bacterium]